MLLLVISMVALLLSIPLAICQMRAICVARRGYAERLQAVPSGQHRLEFAAVDEDAVTLYPRTTRIKGFPTLIEFEALPIWHQVLYKQALKERTLMAKVWLAMVSTGGAAVVALVIEDAYNAVKKAFPEIADRGLEDAMHSMWTAEWRVFVAALSILALAFVASMLRLRARQANRLARLYGKASQRPPDDVPM